MGLSDDQWSNSYWPQQPNVIYEQGVATGFTVIFEADPGMGTVRIDLITLVLSISYGVGVASCEVCWAATPEGPYAPILATSTQWPLISDSTYPNKSETQSANPFYMIAGGILGIRGEADNDSLATMSAMVAYSVTNPTA